MHPVVKTLRLQATIDRYLDREMPPAEADAFIASLTRHPGRRALLDREIRFRTTLQRRAERLPASRSFMDRLRRAIDEA